MKHKRIFGNLKFLDLISVVIICGVIYFLITGDRAVHFDGPKDHELRGHPKLIDGDSIVLDGVEMRLIGMDAVELHQLCGKGDEEYHCGVEAKNHLERIIGNDIISCRWSQKDMYQRALASCFKGDILLNRQMVVDGYAVSFNDYPSEEKQARQQKRGIWRSTFERPKNWRRKHPW